MPRRHNKIPSVSCNRADFGWVRTRNSTITGGSCSDPRMCAKQFSKSWILENFFIKSKNCGGSPLLFAIISAILYSV